MGVSSRVRTIAKRLSHRHMVANGPWSVIRTSDGSLTQGRGNAKYICWDCSPSRVTNCVDFLKGLAVSTSCARTQLKARALALVHSYDVMYCRSEMDELGTDGCRLDTHYGISNGQSEAIPTATRSDATTDLNCTFRIGLRHSIRKKPSRVTTRSCTVLLRMVFREVCIYFSWVSILCPDESQEFVPMTDTQMGTLERPLQNISNHDLCRNWLDVNDFTWGKYHVQASRNGNMWLAFSFKRACRNEITDWSR
jgi:hypothetical protein